MNRTIEDIQKDIELLGIKGGYDIEQLLTPQDCRRLSYETERLNNIINELEIDIENRIYMIEPKGTHINFNDCDYECEEDYINGVETRTELDVLKYILNKLQELKGEDKE